MNIKLAQFILKHHNLMDDSPESDEKFADRLHVALEVTEVDPDLVAIIKAAGIDQQQLREAAVRSARKALAHFDDVREMFEAVRDYAVKDHGRITEMELYVEREVDGKNYMYTMSIDDNREPLRYSYRSPEVGTEYGSNSLSEEDFFNYLKNPGEK